MSTKFFNNTPANTLFEKLKGIANGMSDFNRFLAVVGYFRSSGYFKLRKELGDVSDIRILIGINADDIFRKHNLGWEMLEAPERAKELYNEQFKQDIVDSPHRRSNTLNTVLTLRFLLRSFHALTSLWFRSPGSSTLQRIHPSRIPVTSY